MVVLPHFVGAAYPGIVLDVGRGAQVVFDLVTDTVRTADDDVFAIGSIDSALPCTLITLEEGTGKAASRFVAEGGRHSTYAACRPVGAAMCPVSDSLAVAWIFAVGVLEDVPADAAVLLSSSKIVMVAVGFHHHLQTDAHLSGPDGAVGCHRRGDVLHRTGVVNVVLSEAEAGAEHQLGIVGIDLGVVVAVDVVGHYSACHAVTLRLAHVVGIGHWRMVGDILTLSLCIVLLVGGLQEFGAAGLDAEIHMVVNDGIAVERCPVVGELGLAHVVAGNHQRESLVVLHRCHLGRTFAGAACVGIVGRSRNADGNGFIVCYICLCKYMVGTHHKQKGNNKCTKPYITSVAYHF